VSYFVILTEFHFSDDIVMCVKEQSVTSLKTSQPVRHSSRLEHASVVARMVTGLDNVEVLKVLTGFFLWLGVQ